MFSTLWDIMNTLGVFRSVGDTMSTSRGYHDECGGYHEYCRGCSAHWGDTMSTLGGYHDECGVST